MNTIIPSFFCFAFTLFFQTPVFSQTLDDPSPVLPPESDLFCPTHPNEVTTHQSSHLPVSFSVQESTGKIVGFSLVNEGPNSIIPKHAIEIGMGPDREFGFHFAKRARQDLYFSITDTPTEYLSQRMESYFYLFPRAFVPAIEIIDQGTPLPKLKVTLQNGETVIFNAKTNEVLSGVLEETAPIDLNPDRFSRKFAAIHYTGTGTLIRVNRRGGDPRLGTTATVSQGLKTCKIPSSALFNQDENSSVEFLYPTDEAFNTVLKKRCGFGFL